MIPQRAFWLVCAWATLIPAQVRAQGPIYTAQADAPTRVQGRLPAQSTGAAPRSVAPQVTQEPKKSASGASGPPYSFTAPQLTVTGTGALAAAQGFAPVVFTAPALTLTGTGALATVAPFAPVRFTAPGLTVTGTGSLR